MSFQITSILFVHIQILQQKEEKKEVKNNNLLKTLSFMFFFFVFIKNKIVIFNEIILIRCAFSNVRIGSWKKVNFMI